MNYTNSTSAAKQVKSINLIEYNKKNLEENDGEEKEAVHIELTEYKVDLKNNENSFDSWWSDVQG